MNHVLYDKEKYVSKNVMKKFPDDKYDENDKIEIFNLIKSKFDKNVKLTCDSKQLMCYIVVLTNSCKNDINSSGFTFEKLQKYFHAIYPVIIRKPLVWE